LVDRVDAALDALRAPENGRLVAERVGETLHRMA
jgi:hypothetical protein